MREHQEKPLDGFSICARRIAPKRAPVNDPAEKNLAKNLANNLANNLAPLMNSIAAQSWQAGQWKVDRPDWTMRATVPPQPGVAQGCPSRS